MWIKVQDLIVNSKNINSILKQDKELSICYLNQQKDTLFYDSKTTCSKNFKKIYDLLKMEKEK